MTELQQLGDLVEFINGDRSTNYPNGTDFIADGIPFISATELNKGRVDIINSKRISLKAFERLRAGKIKHGDILYCLRGTLGKIGLVSDFDEGAIASSLTIIRPKENVDARFIYYYLASPIGQQEALALNNGSAQPNISVKSISQILLLAPTFSEQTAISTVLGSIDDKIELNRQMNETLEAMARALFKDWFVDFGPTRRQMEGATDPTAIMGKAFPPEKATALAPLFPEKFGDDGLPEGWDKQPVGELAKIVGGGTPNTKTEKFWEGGTHLWATPRDLSKLSGVFIGDTERKLTDAGLAKVSSGLSPKGSVLMSSRAPIGYLAIASRPVAVNQGFIVIRPTKSFPTHFGKLWCEANMETIEANANGSTFQEISKKNFKPILATVASPEVMEAFTDLVSILFDKIQTNGEENQTLAKIRDLLLPKLMSGEIRLKDAEKLVK